MAKKKQNKGLLLFIKVAKITQKEFKKQGRTESWQEIQKWTSANIYPKFKGTKIHDLRVGNVNKEINILLGITPQVKEIPCFNPFALRDLRDISDVDWWDVANVLETLPNNLQVRINAGDRYGETRIVQRSEINPELDIAPIIEKIREQTLNKSGDKFEGLIKVIPNKKDDGKPCSYFVDFVLEADQHLVIEEPLAEEIEIEKETKEERVTRFKEAEKQKRKTKTEKTKTQKTREAKKRVRPTKTKDEVEKIKEPKVIELPKVREGADAESIRALKDLINDLRQDVREGLITKKFYQEEIARLTKKLKEGGTI